MTLVPQSDDCSYCLRLMPQLLGHFGVRRLSVVETTQRIGLKHRIFGACSCPCSQSQGGPRSPGPCWYQCRARAGVQVMVEHPKARHRHRSHGCGEVERLTPGVHSTWHCSPLALSALSWLPSSLCLPLILPLVCLA